MNWKEFEDYARTTMSKFLETALTKGNPRGFPKEFDMVSSDGQIVGDAKFLTLVRRERIPPAKFMEIAGHVWLLEKVDAKRRFLVFGNQREVPVLWLKKYGKLVREVEFYFLDEDGKVGKLN